MYKVALVLSVAIWAVVIANIFSTPTDVRRRVRMLREAYGKTTPAIHALRHARSQEHEHARQYVHCSRATCSFPGCTDDVDCRVVEFPTRSGGHEFAIVCDGAAIAGVAGRARAVIDEQPRQRGSRAVALSAGVGFAQSGHGLTDVSELVVQRRSEHVPPSGHRFDRGPLRVPRPKTPA
jgi:hypothetical protein